MKEVKRQLLGGGEVMYLVPENEADKRKLDKIQREQGSEGNDSFADVLNPDQSEDFLNLDG
jgi:hypothetical protein